MTFFAALVKMGVPWAIYIPSLISIVILLETTSLEAKSFATGAYLSINLSPFELIKKPPSPKRERNIFYIFI